MFFFANYSQQAAVPRRKTCLSRVHDLFGGLRIPCRSRQVVPFEPFQNSEETFSSMDSFLEFKALLLLDPNNIQQIDAQYEITRKRRDPRAKLDRLTDLCESLLPVVYEFLDRESIVQLRATNRNMLLFDLIHGRKQLQLLLSSKIRSGFSCLQNSTLSAFYLLKMRRPLSSLVSKDLNYKSSVISPMTLKDIKILEYRLDNVTDLKELLLIALKYYRMTDFTAFWELVEVIMKTKLLQADEFFHIINFTIDDVFNFACQYGLLCLAKHLLQEQAVPNIPLLYSGCFICIYNDNYKLFKLIVCEIYRNNFKMEQKLVNLLGQAVINGKLEYLKLLLKMFPTLSDFRSTCLFLAINYKNTTVMNYLLTFEEDLNYRELSCSGYNLIEYAVKKNFSEGVEILCKTEGIPAKFFGIFTLKTAINCGANESLGILLKQITRNFSLDLIFTSLEISLLIKKCLTKRNSVALKMILESVSSRSLEYFQVLNEEKAANNYNFITYAIEIDFIEAFDILVDHFGVEALEQVDNLGNSPFLIAVTNGSIELIQRIEKLNHKSVHITDNNQNNALHLALQLKQSYQVINTISGFNLNWEAENFESLTPIDLLKHLSNFLTEKEFMNIYNIVNKAIHS